MIHKMLAFNCMIAFTMCSTVAFADSGPLSESWPESDCADGDMTLVFTELELCIPKDDVHRVEHLRLSGPSASINVRVNGRPLEIGLLWFDGGDAVGGLDDHIGVSTEDVFRILSGDMEHDQKGLVEDVLYVTDETDVTVYQGDGMTVYALTRPPEAHSSMYIFREAGRGVIKAAGPFEGDDAAVLLSLMCRPACSHEGARP